jgi:phospholipase C
VTRRPRIPRLDAEQRRRAELNERAEARHPEAVMKRRDFLGKTAALAGAAGLAAALPSEAVIREAARLQARATSLPSPANMPIDNFVVLMMENRSFDHYFGWHPTADAVNAGLSYPDASGSPVATHHLPPDFQGCAYRDPDHSWDGGRHQWGGGKMNGFVQGNADGDGSDEFAAGYYEKEDLGFIPHAADAFQLHDRFFCSIMASTYPNRHYMWAAQNGGQKGNDIPAGTLGNQWETIFDRALANGVSATYFNSDLPFAALYGTRGLSWTQPISSFYARAAAGTLPNISFVDPPFADGGGGDGLSGDEHPHGDVRIGQAFMSDVVHAFMESPQFRTGALFIVYDEWGGFFDHVQPRFVPDDRESKDLFQNWGMSGFRIPAVVVSPFARRGEVSHASCMFESILKLISHRFRLGNLTKRHRYAFNIGRTFNWGRPDFDVPDLPDPVAITDGSCTSQGFSAAGSDGAPAERAKPHDLMLLESTGYLDRLGFEYEPASFDRIFREPDSVSKALRESYARAAADAG